MVNAWTDEQMLEALHLRDHAGLSYDSIGDRFGKSKNAVAGLFNRIRSEEQPGDAGNGTMKPKWWVR